MARLKRDGIAEPIPRDQILRRERAQGNINFPCSADRGQDWQPYPLIHTLLYVMTIHTYILKLIMLCNRGEMGRSLVTTGRMVMMRSIGYKYVGVAHYLIV